MLPSSLPIVGEMLSNKSYRDFVVELDETLREDPNYTARKLRRIFDGAARGERILRFEDRFVISSFVPPVPSRAFVTFVTAGIDKGSLFSDLAYARRSAPLSVHLCMTNRCMYRCEHCGATATDGRAELTTAEWIKVLRGLQEMGIAYMAFSGGEPLMRDDMEEIIGALDDRSTTLLFTNGERLTSQRARALKRSGLFTLAVSLDSPSPEEQNRVRGDPNAFSAAVEAIRSASQAGLYTLVSSVVYGRDLNQENLLRLFRLAKEHGAHEVRIHHAVPRGKLAEADPADGIFYTKKDISRLFKTQFVVNRTMHGLPKVSCFPYTEGPCKFGCGAGVLHSYITSTGELWPCDFVPLSFGNVLKEDPKDAYGRMIAAAGIPRGHCMARAIAGDLKGRELPLPEAEAVEFCRACRSESYPRFFRDLQRP